MALWVIDLSAAGITTPDNPAAGFSVKFTDFSPVDEVQFELIEKASIISCHRDLPKGEKRSRLSIANYEIASSFHSSQRRPERGFSTTIISDI